MGGAHLYGFTETDFQKADQAAAAGKSTHKAGKPAGKRAVAIAG